MESMMIWMPIAMAIIGLAYMLVKKYWVMKQDAGDGKMKEISDHIYEGALAFLSAEYRLLTLFVVSRCKCRIGTVCRLFCSINQLPHRHCLLPL